MPSSYRPTVRVVPGTVLAVPAFGPDGRLLLNAGAVLDNQKLQALFKWRVDHVQVYARR